MFTYEMRLAPREKFIGAMRQVASSVTVVTTEGSAGRFGATVSAFSSVSADPPTVLVCLYAESRIARAVSENKRFAVNVLPEDCAEIADRFAGRHDDVVDDRFDGITCSGEMPLIEGAVAFECDLQQTVRSGSHLILIGHVRDVQTVQTAPLTYRDGAYHRVIRNENQCIKAAS